MEPGTCAGDYRIYDLLNFYEESPVSCFLFISDLIKYIYMFLIINNYDKGINISPSLKKIVCLYDTFSMLLILRCKHDHNKTKRLALHGIHDNCD